MSHTLFDLLVVFAVAKEAWAGIVGRYLPPDAAVVILIALPFLVGLSAQGGAAFAQSPIAALLRAAVGLVSLAVFVVLDLSSGTGGLSLAFLTTSVAPYVLGRGAAGVTRGLVRVAVVGTLILMAFTWVTVLGAS